MDWLTQAFSEQSIAWLVLVVASGFLSSWLTSRFIKRDDTRYEARVQAEICKEVEEFLGKQSAEREYNLEARKRLYQAIGPLRFQLMVACRDAASRVERYGEAHRYATTVTGYYGRNTLYRLLRPIAIAELIEQQIAYADFSVDLSAIDLLRFKRAAYKAFTDDDPILHHPNANWSRETEHLFSGTVSRLANSLIVQDEEIINKKRPMYFHEFESFISNPKDLEKFSPLVEILEGFTAQKKPIFWLRMICYGFICNEYIGKAGSAIGFEREEFDLQKLLYISQDEYTVSNIEKFQKVIQSTADAGL